MSMSSRTPSRHVRVPVMALSPTTPSTRPYPDAAQQPTRHPPTRQGPGRNAPCRRPPLPQRRRRCAAGAGGASATGQAGVEGARDTTGPGRGRGQDEADAIGEAGLGDGDFDAGVAAVAAGDCVGNVIGDGIGTMGARPPAGAARWLRMRRTVGMLASKRKWCRGGQTPETVKVSWASAHTHHRPDAPRRTPLYQLLGHRYRNPLNIW